MGQQKANLNMEEKPTIAAAVLRIREVMQYRAEKIVFVRARRDVSWGEFMQMVDQVWPEAQVVSLVTAPVQSQAAKTYTLNPSCRDCRKFGGFQSR